MSVSQVKKQFEEFATYLGRDAEGLRRLKLLKDAVNVLRTDLAAAVHAKELSESIKDAARDRADIAVQESSALRLEAARLTAQVASLTYDLASLTKPDEEASEDPELSPVQFAREMKSTIKALLRSPDMPRCPQLHKAYVRDDGLPGFSIMRSDIVKDWSRRSLYLLGAVVALLVDYTGEIRIQTTDDTVDTRSGKVKDEALCRHMHDWMGMNYDIVRLAYEAAERGVS